MKKLIDKLVPGSVSDLLIIIICIGLAWFLFTHFGQMGLAALFGIGLQGNNEKRREAQKEKERLDNEVKQAVSRVEENNAQVDGIENEIVKIDGTPFTDNEESNAEVVDNIRRNGL